jgi:cytochrome P450
MIGVERSLTGEQAIAALSTPAAAANPYPIYDRLRQLAALHPVPGQDRTWFLTEWADCNAVLRSKRFRSGVTADRLRADSRFATSATMQAFAGMLFFIDPPDLVRLRSLVNRAFTPRIVQNVAAYVSELTNGLLDELAAAREFDVVADFAHRIPGSVICEMLGVPREDHAEFSRWNRTIAQSFGPGLAGGSLDGVDAATESLEFYLDQLIAARRVSPRRDDLLSDLIAAEQQTGRLGHDELVRLASILLGAGTETTETLIGGGVAALLGTPDQLQRLRDDPSLDRTAVEELLRFEGPVQLTHARQATEDVVLPSGQTLPAGGTVIAMIPAANRDPAVFPDPQQLDVARTPNRHLQFAAGMHMCVGAGLARTEGAICIPALLRRFRRLRLGAEPTWAMAGGGLRSIASVRVSSGH